MTKYISGLVMYKNNLQEINLNISNRSINVKKDNKI